MPGTCVSWGLPFPLPWANLSSPLHFLGMTHRQLPVSRAGMCHFLVLVSPGLAVSRTPPQSPLA